MTQAGTFMYEDVVNILKMNILYRDYYLIVAVRVNEQVYFFGPDLSDGLFRYEVRVNLLFGYQFFAYASLC